MANRVTRLDAAIASARKFRVEIGRDIRNARLNAGMSQRAAAALVGMSHSQFGRIERAELDDVTVEQLARACEAVGLRLFARAIPDADPAVDAGQLGVLTRVRALLPAGAPFDTEVPFPIAGDRRAWDALLRLDRTLIAIEAETRLRDIGALDRKCQLKLRDGGVDILIVAVADTAWNRRMLDEHRAALRATFPLDGRQIRPALRAGKAPSGNGIVVL